MTDDPSGGTKVLAKAASKLWFQITAYLLVLVLGGTGTGFAFSASGRATDHDAAIAKHEEAISTLKLQNQDLRAEMIRIEDKLDTIHSLLERRP